MSNVVRLIGGTDELRLEEDGKIYHVGDVIRSLSNQRRLALQASGVRFAAVHDDDPPEAPAPEPAVQIPPDQAAVNEELAQSSSKTAPKSAAKGDQ